MFVSSGCCPGLPPLSHSRPPNIWSVSGAQGASDGLHNLRAGKERAPRDPTPVWPVLNATSRPAHLPSEAPTCPLPSLSRPISFLSHFSNGSFPSEGAAYTFVSHFPLPFSVQALCGPMYYYMNPCTKCQLKGPENCGGCNCSDVTFEIRISKLEVVQ